MDRIGVPDVVTVTAGIGHGAMLLDAPADDWDRVVGINAKGVWLVMRALAAPMLDGAGGSIVATSSVSARLADRSMGLYGASKAALDMVVRVAGIGVGADRPGQRRRPGVTDTPMLGPAPATALGSRASPTGRRSAGSAAPTTSPGRSSASTTCRG